MAHCLSVEGVHLIELPINYSVSDQLQVGLRLCPCPRSSGHCCCCCSKPVVQQLASGSACDAAEIRSRRGFKSRQHMPDLSGRLQLPSLLPSIFGAAGQKCCACQASGVACCGFTAPSWKPQGLGSHVQARTCAQVPALKKQLAEILKPPEEFLREADAAVSQKAQKQPKAGVGNVEAAASKNSSGPDESELVSQFTSFGVLDGDLQGLPRCHSACLLSLSCCEYPHRPGCCSQMPVAIAGQPCQVTGR